MSCGMCTRITNEPRATLALASGTKLRRQQLPVQQYVFLANYMPVSFIFAQILFKDLMYVNKALNYSGFCNRCFFFFKVFRVLETIGITNCVSATIAPTHHYKYATSGNRNGTQKTIGGDIS